MALGGGNEVWPMALWRILFGYSTTEMPEHDPIENTGVWIDRGHTEAFTIPLLADSRKHNNVSAYKYR